MTILLAGGGGLLSFNPGFALWVLLSMILFIFVMAKYAVPPIMKALVERENRIKDSLESAEKALEKAEQISQDNKKALREAEAKAQQIHKEAIEQADLVRQERIEKAKEEADLLLENARLTIEQEKKQALEELRKEVAELAIQSASMILDSEIDKTKNTKIVNDFIDDLSKN